jgi:hypothetical protein
VLRTGHLAATRRPAAAAGHDPDTERAMVTQSGKTLGAHGVDRKSRKGYPGGQPSCPGWAVTVSRCGRGGAVARARQRVAIPRQLRGGLGCVPGDLRRREPRERPQHRVRVRGRAPLKPLHHLADCLDQQLAAGLRHDPLLGSRLGHVPQHDARRHLGLESRRNTFRVTQYLQLAGQRVGELTAGRRR